MRKPFRYLLVSRDKKGQDCTIGPDLYAGDNVQNSFPQRRQHNGVRVIDAEEYSRTSSCCFSPNKLRYEFTQCSYRLKERPSDLEERTQLSGWYSSLSSLINAPNVYSRFFTCGVLCLLYFQNFPCEMMSASRWLRVSRSETDKDTSSFLRASSELVNTRTYFACRSSSGTLLEMDQKLHTGTKGSQLWKQKSNNNFALLKLIYSKTVFCGGKGFTGAISK